MHFNYENQHQEGIKKTSNLIGLPLPNNRHCSTGRIEQLLNGNLISLQYYTLQLIVPPLNTVQLEIL
jgi:hypothetical protein